MAISQKIRQFKGYFLKYANKKSIFKKLSSTGDAEFWNICLPLLLLFTKKKKNLKPTVKRKRKLLPRQISLNNIQHLKKRTLTKIPISPCPKPRVTPHTQIFGFACFKLSKPPAFLQVFLSPISRNYFKCHILVGTLSIYLYIWTFHVCSLIGGWVHVI